MSTLGEKLRSAREQKNLSVSEVAEGTHIKVQIIEDLEQNEFRKIPAVIYGKGFIRMYAEFVGLEPDPLVAEYAARVTRVAAPPVAVPPPRPPPAMPPARPGAGPQPAAAAPVAPSPLPPSPAMPPRPAAAIAAPVRPSPAPAVPSPAAAPAPAAVPPPSPEPASEPAPAPALAPAAAPRIEAPRPARVPSVMDEPLFAAAAARAAAAAPPVEERPVSARDGDRPRAPAAASSAAAVGSGTEAPAAPGRPARLARPLPPRPPPPGRLAKIKWPSIRWPRWSGLKWPLRWSIRRTVGGMNAQLERSRPRVRFSDSTRDWGYEWRRWLASPSVRIAAATVLAVVIVTAVVVGIARLPGSRASASRLPLAAYESRDPLTLTHEPPAPYIETKTAQ